MLILKSDMVALRRRFHRPNVLYPSFKLVVLNDERDVLRTLHMAFVITLACLS